MAFVRARQSAWGATRQIGTRLARHLVHKYGCFKLVQSSIIDKSTRDAVPGAGVTALPDSAWLLRPAMPLSQPADGPQSLAGLRFAVKDNIDVAGWRTTAGCAEFAFEASTSAQVVHKLLSAGAALVVAGLVATGQTIVSDIHHIDRGYDDLVGRLAGLGARITRRS